MSYIYRLAGEDLELAKSELDGFLKSQGIEKKSERSGSIAESENHPRQLKRLALVHEVSEKISEAEELEDLKIPEVLGSFAVRAENLSEEEIDKSKIESFIGSSIENEKNNVDLENPATVFKAYFTPDKIILGKVVEDINRGLFGKRKNDLRPFSSPISMDPVLARVLVNLSEVKPGERILDPFCGTGGILIEAGLCGVGVSGRDISEEMIEGTKKNLEEYGIINHDLKQQEISETETDKYNTIITDLPYGQASKKTDDAVEAFFNIINNFDGKTVFMYNEASVKGYDADFSVYIHKNLTRYIYVI